VRVAPNTASSSDGRTLVPRTRSALRVVRGRSRRSRVVQTLPHHFPSPRFMTDEGGRALRQVPAGGPAGWATPLSTGGHDPAGRGALPPGSESPDRDIPARVRSGSSVSLPGFHAPQLGPASIDDRPTAGSVGYRGFSSTFSPAAPTVSRPKPASFPRHVPRGRSGVPFPWPPVSAGARIPSTARSRSLRRVPLPMSSQLRVRPGGSLGSPKGRRSPPSEGGSNRAARRRIGGFSRRVPSVRASGPSRGSSRAGSPRGPGSRVP